MTAAWCGEISIVSAQHARHERRRVSWAAMVESLSKPVLRPVAEGVDPDTVKHALPAWSPATFKAGQPRSKSACEAVHLLALDFDGLARFEIETFISTDWLGCAHTSWNHSTKHHKFRIVFPLAHPVPAPGWPRVFAWARELWPDIDPRCCNPDRLYFRSAIRANDWPFRFTSWDGPVLDLDAEQLPLAPGVIPKPRVAPPPYRAPSPAAAEREFRRRLREEPIYRERLAFELGATLRGAGPDQRAVKIACPGCGQRDVWFHIQPNRASNARCNHQSCGWCRPLHELASVGAM